MPRVPVRLGEERLSRHERHIHRQRGSEQCAGVQRLLEGQPEKQPSLGHVPVRDVGKMRLQRGLEPVATIPVEVPQFAKVAAVLLGADPLQRLPLADAIGVQVRRLLEPQQVREQVRTGNQVTHPQPRQQGLRHGAGVDPTGLLQAADNRCGAAAVESQFAVGFVFDQGHAEFIQQGRHRVALGLAVAHCRRVLERGDQVDECRPVLFQACSQLLQVRPIGLQGHSNAVGAEQLENLQRRQVGRRFQHDLGADVDVQLRRQVEGLLRAADHQHLTRLTGQAQCPRLRRQGFAQGRLAFAHAVLTHGQRHGVPLHFRQHGFGGQTAGERHHLRALGRREDFSNQRTFEARDTFGKSHGDHL
ncbi:hypothetical protein SRABI112_03409 [Pseudomonas mediterranea]|nr:hypothetical protein SRABI112_03409 [Pseudomonas mediterranea]